MIKAPIILAAFIGAFVLGGCSWSTTFIVANLSSTPIRLSYSVGRFGRDPAVKRIRDVKDQSRPWVDVFVEFEGHDSTRVHTFTLGPDSAFRIGEMGTYTGYQDYYAEAFNEVALTIASQSGSRAYRGDEVLKAFTKWSRTVYALEYR
jgi:hypothetical protein